MSPNAMLGTVALETLPAVMIVAGKLVRRAIIACPVPEQPRLIGT